MVQFSNNEALATAMVIVPTIQHFCTDFKWFLTKWWPFVQISYGWASGFQILFEIQTICNPTSFWLVEIQTSPDFRSPLQFCILLPNGPDLEWHLNTTIPDTKIMGSMKSAFSRLLNLHHWTYIIDEFKLRLTSSYSYTYDIAMS